MRQNHIKPLSDFFAAIENDYRISPMHIAVYAALMQYRSGKGFVNSIMVFSSEIIAIAKISSANTYHRCIRKLDNYMWNTSRLLRRRAEVKFILNKLISCIWDLHGKYYTF